VVGTRRVKGDVSGEMDAALGSHVKPRLRANLTADGVSVGRSRATGTGKAALSVDVDERNVAAKVRFDQTTGYAEASASAGLIWKSPLAPTIDPERAAQARADAKGFRIAIL